MKSCLFCGDSPRGRCNVVTVLHHQHRHHHQRTTELKNAFWVKNLLPYIASEPQQTRPCTTVLLRSGTTSYRPLRCLKSQINTTHLIRISFPPRRIFIFSVVARCKRYGNDPPVDGDLPLLRGYQSTVAWNATSRRTGHLSSVLFLSRMKPPYSL